LAVSASCGFQIDSLQLMTTDRGWCGQSVELATTLLRRRTPLR
jgi:hypothetical protein